MVDRFVNRLINSIFDSRGFDIENVNPYLLYYFYPKADREQDKVDRGRSLNDFRERFDAFEILNEVNKRRNNLIQQYTNLSYKVVEVKARLINGAVPGIGIESPYESGLRLHYIYGIPFIPASSIKGAYSQYLKDFKGLKESDPDYTLRFGSQEKEGNLIFLDAYPELPEDKQIFDISIINTHYQKYYNKEAFPADYYSPIPNKFLIIKGGTEFRFHIIIKPVNELKVDDVAKEFADALLKQGVGAKTKVGFGHFKVAEGT